MILKNKKKGMTILELLLTVAIILILSGATIGYYRGQITEMSLGTTSKTFVSDINFAKMRAMAGDKGMDWGIRVFGGGANSQGGWALFATTTFDMKTEPFIEEKNILPSGLFWESPSSGEKEVVFKALSGSVSSTQFILAYSNQKIEINIDQSGEIKLKRL